MNTYLKRLIKAIETNRDEDKKIAKVLRYVNRESRVLEVGCGFGEKMDLLQSLGFKNILGVEKNEEIVRQVQEHGKNVISVREFEEEHGDDRFDLVVTSHVIEHFQWEKLKDFLDYYLEFLDDEGMFLVVTPVLHPFFYDDFDHVKPYYPAGIYFVYGGKDQQVQVYSRHVLQLKDICFRRQPYEIKFSRSLYIETYNRLPRLINILLALAYKVSFGMIGRTTGWIGLYVKSSSSPP